MRPVNPCVTASILIPHRSTAGEYFFSERFPSDANEISIYSKINVTQNSATTRNYLKDCDSSTEIKYYSHTHAMCLCHVGVVTPKTIHLYVTKQTLAPHPPKISLAYTWRYKCFIVHANPHHMPSTQIENNTKPKQRYSCTNFQRPLLRWSILRMWFFERCGLSPGVAILYQDVSFSTQCYSKLYL